MKKIIKLLYFLLVINLIIFFYLSVKIHYNDLLPISYAKNYTDNNYNLILSILKDSNKDNLIQYIDYIDLKTITSLPNDNKDNKYFILSLPGNTSIIAIYDKNNSDTYKYHYSIDNLSSIDNLYKYKDFLVIEQSTPSISNEFDNKYFEVFALKNNEYTSVFNKNIYSEKIITNNNSIFKEIEKGSIDCLDGEVPRILCITTIIKYENNSMSDLDNSFIELYNTTQKETYQWNIDTKEFSLMKTEVIK